ncbi:histidine kinase [Pontibacter sp. 172403-2]|uniref:histidine kinase n=1 Tax=Pontibacter rufus TaxID=2791028 RepID=UPI0018AFAED6|nr:histidine kinase [Pontibacter sp. 172403-2]MBF9252628.1 histidine kinase [Pontibacter sp. 172403-2]
MNLAQIDIQQLRIKHILYKSKVRATLYGGVFDEAFFSRLGPVGTWFSAVGQVRYAHEPETRQLASVHQELDAVARQLYRLYSSGKIDEAHEELRSIEKLSERFLNVLSKLEDRLKEVV